MGKFYETKIALRTSELAEQNKWMAKDANAIDIWATEMDERVTNIETGSTNQIIVSAIWTSGFSFDCTADSFPIDGIYYSAPDTTLTLDGSDVTLDRIDLIVAKKAIAPATQGTIEIIKGDLATSALVVPNDYDPSEYYVIKQILVKAGEVSPKDPITETTFSQNLVFSENVGEPTEWTASVYTGSVDFDSTVSYSGTKSAFYDTSGVYSRAIYTNDAAINTDDVSEITFWYKQNESSNKFFFLKFFNGTTNIKTILYRLGSDSTSATSLDWQKIIIDKTKLALPNTTIDSFQLYLFKNTGTGYYIDDLIVNSGSSVQQPIGNIEIEEAPLDGKEYNRKNASWVEDTGVMSNSIGLSELKDELKARVDLATGTNLNWSLGISFIHDTLLTDLTLTFSNLPQGTDTKTITLDLDLSTFSIILPVYCISKGGDASISGKTKIVLECINGNVGFEEVYYSLIPNV